MNKIFGGGGLLRSSHITPEPPVASSRGKHFPGFSFSLLSLQIPDKNEFYNNGKWLPEMVWVDLAGPPSRITPALWDVF